MSTELSRRSPRRRSESGASAVEFSIIAPLMLALVFLVITAALYLYGRDVAQSASREGVSYLRLAGSNSDPDAFRAGAKQVAEGYAKKLGRLHDVSAEVPPIDEKNGRVEVTVTGYVTLPVGGDKKITQTSYATLEQFRPDFRDGDVPDGFGP